MATLLEIIFGKSKKGTSEDVRKELSINGFTSTPVNYTVENRTDVVLARQLYHNKNNSYTLAAQLVKPIVNNNVNFIGKPKLYGNRRTLDLLKSIDLKIRKIHKAVEIDGNQIVWVRWDNKKKKIVLELVPFEVLSDIFIDPFTKEIIGYRFIEEFTYATEDNSAATMKIEYVITAEKQVTTVLQSSELVAKKITTKNIFGVLPVVMFSNDTIHGELYGHSEIESIEPQLRLYHELTFEAAAAQKRDGHPKLKLKTKNAKVWLDNNFGPGTYESLQAGRTQLSLDDRDFFLNQDEEDVQYLYLQKVSGDFKDISQTTFTNIVEGSETPEINFGANLGTSLASVKEYRPVWIKKIEAKQEERELSWKKLFDVITAVHNYVSLDNLSAEDITFEWPKPNFVSIKEQSEILRALSAAIVALRKDGQLNNEEIFETLKSLGFIELDETYEKHRKKIEEMLNDDAERAKANQPEVKDDTNNNSNTEELEEKEGNGKE